MVTREAAEQRCRELNASGDGHWLPRRSPTGIWEVVRVRGAGVARRGPLTTSSESRPRPDQPPDPPFRDVPSHWGVG